MLSVEVQGEADRPTLVLLHSLALDRSVWSRIVPYLAPRYRVVTVDLPGHGASRGTTPTTIEAMGDAVAVALEPHVDDPVVLAGLSLGGCVAQSVAIAHPSLVAGLALIDTTAWYGEDAAERWASRVEAARAGGLASLAGFQIDRWFSRDPGNLPAGLADALLATFVANDVDDYAATCHAMGAMDLRNGLPEIRVPTCVIVGEDDYATPVTFAVDIRERVPDATLHVLPRLGHLSPVEDPLLVASTLEGDLPVRLWEEQRPPLPD